MCIVSTCCGCTDLTQGSKIIAIVQIVLGAIAFITSIVFLYIIGIVASVINVCVGLILLFAILKSNDCLALTWLIITIISIIFSCIGWILMVVAVAAGGDVLGDSNALGIAIGMIILYTFQIGKIFNFLSKFNIFDRFSYFFILHF